MHIAEGSKQGFIDNIPYKNRSIEVKPQSVRY